MGKRKTSSGTMWEAPEGKTKGRYEVQSIAFAVGGGGAVGGGTFAETRVTDPVTGGQKGQKPERYDLLPFDALDEVARVYGQGAEKYEAHNWAKGYRWSLSCGALLRHVSLFLQGEDCDPETGRHHLAHAVFHCFTLIAFGRRRLGTDDRAKVRR